MPTQNRRPQNNISSIQYALLPFRKLKRALQPGIIAFLVSTALAQEPAGVGTIEGRVLNGLNGQYLNNARVYVDKTSYETYTNDSGEYVLKDIPAGEIILNVSYTGQAVLSKTITLLPGETLTKYFTFNSPVSEKNEEAALVLDPYLVEQKRMKTARERAIQDERASTNIKTVVATDAMGYNPDGNVGEFVRYLAGVDVSEGGTYNNPNTITGVSVRGFGADSTAILVDGMPLASAPGAGLTRATQIDMVSINNADRIEVIKVATPDMRQDSPGGAINLIPRGAFDLAKATFTFSAALNGQSNTLGFQKRTGPFKNEGSYSTLPSLRASAAVPVSKTFGFTISAASDNRTTDTQISRPTWIYRSIAPAVRNANGIARLDNPIPSRFRIGANNWLEFRQSGNLSMDWRPFKGLTLKANGQFGRTSTYSADRTADFSFANNATIDDWGIDGSYTIGRAGRLQQNIVTRDKSGFTNSGYVKADYSFGGWAIGARASASESYGAYDDVQNGHFSGMDSNNLNAAYLIFEGIKNGRPGKISMWDSVGREINYSSFEAWGNNNRNLKVLSGEGYSRDLMKQYNLDVTRQLDFLPFRSSIKVGVYRGEKGTHKWGRGVNYSYQYTGPALAASQISSDFSTPAVNGFKDRQYWEDTYKIYDIYKAHPEYFDENYVDPASTTNYQANNYNNRIGQTKGVTEISDEWYLRLDGKFFSGRLDVITGFRESRRSISGYNIFRDAKYAYVKLPNGAVYRDPVGGIYTNGVKFDGGSYTGSTANTDPTSPYFGRHDNVLRDTALIARMRAAGVVDIPDHLALAPNRTAGNRDNNLELAMLNNTTRAVDKKSKNPGTPQLQLAYKVTDELKVQASWSRETRLPDLEGGTGAILNDGANFTFDERDPSDILYNTLGGQGTAKISNVKNQPEITNSYNFRASYYGKYTTLGLTYYLKMTPKQWVDENILPGDPDYDDLMNSIGLDPRYYNNVTISTSTATGEKGKRQGYEVELEQNFGFLGMIGSQIDASVSYNYRAVTANSLSNSSVLGWSRQNPVRPVWQGRVSYSARRFSIMAKWKYTQPGRTGITSTAVTLPDGTNANVMFYTPNNNQAKVGLQFNYTIDRHFRYFISLDNIFDDVAYSRKLDSETGLLPHYAQFTQAQERGRLIATGITATF
ncbi:MAG: TonB-dependent receptor [Nibricoccus sp.]